MSDEELIQIEFLEDYKGAGGPFIKGDKRSLPAEQAKRYIRMGVAEDASGDIPTGKRKVERPVLEAQPIHAGAGTEAK